MRHPWDYKSKNCKELIKKLVKIKYNVGQIENEIQGIVKKCLLSSNPPHIPVSLKISIEGLDKTIDFINMTELELL